jgi:putative membrane protein
MREAVDVTEAHECRYRGRYGHPWPHAAFVLPAHHGMRETADARLLIRYHPDIANVPEPDPGAISMKRILYATAALAAVFFGTTFAIRNNQAVQVSYYFGFDWSGPLSIALLVTFILGVVLGYVASLRTTVRMQRQLVHARKEIRSIEQEVRNLRALPIKDVL